MCLLVVMTEAGVNVLWLRSSRQNEKALNNEVEDFETFLKRRESAASAYALISHAEPQDK